MRACTAIMKDAIEATRAKQATPLVVDVGANHGLYALYAAALGATVIAVEPQASLCEVIRLAASLNGEDVASRITLYNNAVLEKAEMVSMSKSEVEEGAVAHVDRSAAAAGGVQALPIATLAPESLGRISFLKIDVEGFELLAIPSAYPLFAAQRVDHSLIEFGPPSRWSGAGKSEEDGLALLSQLATKDWAFDTRLVQSYAYNDVVKAAALSEASLGGFLEAMRTKQTRGTYLSLADPSLWPALMSGAPPSTHAAHARPHRLATLRCAEHCSGC
jgi:FkbM family methyltransferase